MNRLEFETMLKLALATLFLTTLYGTPALAVPRCDFDYTAHVRDEIVIPAAKKVEGKFTSNWNFTSPGITENKGDIELIFMMRGDYLDPPSLLVVIDPCAMTVKSVGELSPWVTGVPKNAHH